MNGSAVYLGNLINEYKNLYLEARRELFKAHYEPYMDYRKHRQLQEIAKDHGIGVGFLVRVILEDFLTSRKNYADIRDRIDEIWDRYEQSLK